MAKRTPTIDVDALPMAAGRKPFDFHVYFKADSQAEFAADLRTRLLARFDCVGDDGWFQNAGFLHPSPMFVAVISKPEDRGTVNQVIKWLEANRNGLSVLVHPHTTDGFLEDHTTHALWLGTPMKLGVIPTARLVQRYSASLLGVTGAITALFVWRFW